MLLNEMGTHSLNTHSDLIIEVGDAYMSLEHYETALKYFLMVPDDFGGHTVKVFVFLCTVHSAVVICIIFKSN